jgi:hypothetical protein
MISRYVTTLILSFCTVAASRWQEGTGMPAKSSSYCKQLHRRAKHCRNLLQCSRSVSILRKLGPYLKCQCQGGPQSLTEALYRSQFEQEVEAITAKYINSLVELISNGLESLQKVDPHPSAAATGFIEGLGSAEACQRHFRSQLAHIQARKQAAAEGLLAAGEGESKSKGADWNAVQVSGALKKWATPNAATSGQPAQQGLGAI